MRQNTIVIIILTCIRLRVPLALTTTAVLGAFSVTNFCGNFSVVTLWFRYDTPLKQQIQMCIQCTWETMITIEMFAMTAVCEISILSYEPSNSSN